MEANFHTYKGIIKDIRKQAFVLLDNCCYVNVHLQRWRLIFNVARTYSAILNRRK